MKQFATIIATFMLFAVAAPVYGAAFTWTGAQDTHWEHCVSNSDNWGNNTPCEYPGKNRNTDTVTIDAVPATQPVHSTGTNTVDTIAIDANTNGKTVSLTVSGGTLTASGQVTITAGAEIVTGKPATLIVSAGTMDVNAEVQLNGGSVDDAIAKVQITGGTFTPDSIDANGGDSLRRRAEINANTNVVVQGIEGMDTVAQGYVWFNIASTKKFEPKDTKVDASAGHARIRQFNPGEVEPTTLTISAGDAATENAFYWLKAGILDVNGEVELNALSEVAATAELQVDSGTTFTPDSIDVNGGAAAGREVVLDFNASVTATAGAGTELSVDGWVDVELASGVVYTARTVDLVDALTSFQVTGGNSATLARLVLDDFDNDLDGEIIYRNGLQVGFATP